MIPITRRHKLARQFCSSSKDGCWHLTIPRAQNASLLMGWEPKVANIAKALLRLCKVGETRFAREKTSISPGQYISSRPFGLHRDISWASIFIAICIGQDEVTKSPLTLLCWVFRRPSLKSLYLPLNLRAEKCSSSLTPSVVIFITRFDRDKKKFRCPFDTIPCEQIICLWLHMRQMH